MDANVGDQLVFQERAYDLEAMKASSLRTLILMYAIVAGVLSIGCTIIQIPPSLFFINLFAPEEGDTYSVTLVFLLTCLLFLSPLFLYMAIAKARRAGVKTLFKPEMTGVFIRRQKAFVSAMTPIPVFINGEEVGMVDNGRTAFFEVPPGDVVVIAGSGRQASEPIRWTIPDKAKPLLEMHLSAELFSTKVVLRYVADAYQK